MKLGLLVELINLLHKHITGPEIGTSSIDRDQQSRCFHLWMETGPGLQNVISDKIRMMDNEQKIDHH